jgi:hypothetical protein
MPQVLSTCLPHQTLIVVYSLASAHDVSFGSDALSTHQSFKVPDNFAISSKAELYKVCSALYIISRPNSVYVPLFNYLLPSPQP